MINHETLKSLLVIFPHLRHFNSMTTLHRVNLCLEGAVFFLELGHLPEYEIRDLLLKAILCLILLLLLMSPYRL